MRLLLPLLLLIPVTASAKGASVGKLQKRLAHALSKEDEETAQRVIRRLGETDQAAAAKVIVQATSRFPHLQLYGTARETLVGMKDSKVRGWIYKAAKSSRRWLERYLLLQVCGGIGTPKAQAAVRAGVEDVHPTILEALVPHLVEQRTKEGVDALITLLERSEERGLADAERSARQALRTLTGEKIQRAIDWRTWWRQVRGEFDLSKAARAEAGKKRSGGTSVRERIENRNESHYLEKLTKTDVVVIKGVFDKVEDVLTALKIPHTVVERKKANTIKLTPEKVVVINCDGQSPPPETLEQLTGFVARGGYLFTSDWEMHNVLTKAFPKTLTVKKQIPEHEGVRIAPDARAFGHPYLRDVFPSKNPYATTGGMKWKVDGASDLQGPLQKGITPLVFSRELHKLHGVGVVALTFRYDGRIVPPSQARKPTRRKRRKLTGSRGGRSEVPESAWRGGSILHVLGHFNAQTDPKKDGFALQQLLANFIIEKQKQRAFRLKKRKKKR